MITSSPEHGSSSGLYMGERQPPPADDALRLNSSINAHSTAGYNSFGFASPPPHEPSPPPCSNWDGGSSSSSSSGGGGTIQNDAIVGDGGSGHSGGEGGGGRGEHTIVKAGLVVWAAGASLLTAFLASNRGVVQTTTTTAKEPSAAAATAAASFGATTTTTGVGSSKPRTSSSDPKLAGDSNNSKGWCLPNAAHQNFTGVVLKEDDGLLPKGKWEGQHWWYHDEITSGFHMVATLGEETYGFWDLGIIGASGNTEYVAAYKGDECLYYEEEVQPGSTPFDEDVTCRGSAWAGNVTLQKEVGFGYGTMAERWAGVIREDEDTGYGGLPPGTESLIDLQRNPDNDGEVRLLYHRVVAPTEGVLRWAGGDSVAFDLVFTGLEKMTAGDVLDLVKVPGICEVMAGEFHDQQARGNTGGAGGVRGRARARSRALREEITTIGGTPQRTSGIPLLSPPVPGFLGSDERANDARPKQGEGSGPRAVMAAAAGGERSQSSDPVVVRTTKVEAAAAAAAAAAATSVPMRKRERSGASPQAGARSTVGGRGHGEALSSHDETGGGGGPRGLVGAALMGENEKQEEGGQRKREIFGDSYDSSVSGASDASDSAVPDAAAAAAAADPDARADVDGGGRGETQNAEPETAVAESGLLPIHHLMRALGRKGYRRRG